MKQRWIVGGILGVTTLGLVASIAWVALGLNVTIIEIDPNGNTRVKPGWGSRAASSSSVSAQKPAPNIAIEPVKPLPATPTTLSPDQLFAAASPAVAQVQLMDGTMLSVGQGTGFFVSADGYLVTNYHVIRDAAYATIVTADGLAHTVEGVAAVNEKADLALLKVKLTTDNVPTLRLSPLNAAPAIGTRVFAIGNPRGLTNTLSDGLVSGHRDQMVPGVTIVQISAPIGPGSSGGPLMTADGAVVGVTSSGFSDGQNLNFAIPAERVHALLAAKGAAKPLTEPEAANPIKALARAVSAAHKAKERARFAPADQDVLASGPAISDVDLETFNAVASSLQRGDTRAASRMLKDLRSRNDRHQLYWALDAMVHEQLGEMDLAVRSYRRAVEIQPKYAQAYNGLGRALSDLGEDEEAIEAFAAAAKLNPKDDQAYRNAGIAAARLKDYKRAITFFDYAIKLAPKNSDSFRLKGMALADLKRTTEAFAAYDQALRLNPSSAATYLSRGRLKLRLNRPGDAVDALTRAVELDPANAAAHVALGDAYDACGEKANALKSWVAATRLDQSGSSGRLARARLERATMGLTRIE